MKTYIIILINFFFLTLVTFSKEGAEKENYSKFSEASTIEIINLASFSYRKSTYKNEGRKTDLISLHLGLGLNYYVIDKFYIGFAPNFSYSYIKDSHIDTYKNGNSNIGFSPTISLGYTLRLSDNLFLDLSVGGGYYITSSSENKSFYIFTGPILKWDIRNGLINLGLSYNYNNSYYIEHSVFLSFGYSIYL